MKEQFTIERFKSELLECLDETFEQHHGIYLDKDTSLFETLDGISTDESSRQIVENGVTLASHVEHIRFCLDVLVEIGALGDEIRRLKNRNIYFLTAFSEAV